MPFLPPPITVPKIFKPDPGYPYFYKARPTRSPYVLTNPIIGKALAGDFLFAYRFAIKVQRFVESFIPRKRFKAGSGAALAPSPALSGSKKFYSQYSQGPSSVVDLSKKIAIWLWDDYKVQQGAGEPYLRLDFPPTELSFDVSSSLKDIGIVGTNYPRLHYTGSKEVLSFTVSWYDSLTIKSGKAEKNKESIAVKCRKLEALSKADAYSQGPQQIYIDWGAWGLQSGHPGLLEGHIYTVQSANYKMNTFLQHRSHGKRVLANNFDPLHATQEIVLQREANQLTSEQIIHGSL